MKKLGSILILFGLFNASSVYTSSAQNIPDQFGQLARLGIEHSLTRFGYGDIDILYNPGISIVENSVGRYTRDPEHYSPDRRLITTKIDRNAETQYVIEFTEGMSVDPGFIVYVIEPDTLKRLRPILAGTRLIIPGDGFLYVSGHTNNTFDKHRLFRIGNEELVEVEQPFYYVGLESVTNLEIELWNDDAIIATIPKNVPVTVLLNKEDPEWKYTKYSYLVKTDAGLVGWVFFEGPELNMWNDPMPIEGLYYKGD